jgi:hypothetical protein
MIHVVRETYDPEGGTFVPRRARGLDNEVIGESFNPPERRRDNEISHVEAAEKSQLQ